MFPKVPQSSLGILRVPQLPPPLNTPPLRNPTTQGWCAFNVTTLAKNRTRSSQKPYHPFGPWMRLWQGLRRFAEEKSPFGFLENHLRSVPPFRTASPGATVSGRLEKITEHIIQAPNLTRWARIAIDQPYDYIYIIPWGICNHCVPSKKYLYIYIRCFHKRTSNITPFHTC